MSQYTASVSGASAAKGEDAARSAAAAADMAARDMGMGVGMGAGSPALKPRLEAAVPAVPKLHDIDVAARTGMAEAPPPLLLLPLLVLLLLLAVAALLSTKAGRRRGSTHRTASRAAADATILPPAPAQPLPLLPPLPLPPAGSTHEDRAPPRAAAEASPSSSSLSLLRSSLLPPLSPPLSEISITELLSSAAPALADSVSGSPSRRGRFAAGCFVAPAPDLAAAPACSWCGAMPQRASASAAAACVASSRSSSGMRCGKLHRAHQWVTAEKRRGTVADELTPQGYIQQQGCRAAPQWGGKTG